MEGDDFKTEDWRQEHGQPDFAHLMSLAKDGSIEAVEQLRSIADDLDVEYGSEISPEELVELIRTAVQQDGDVNAQPTA